MAETTDEWVIFWWGDKTGNTEMEHYDTQEEARAALADFGHRYPWNTYSLARVVDKCVGTEPAPQGFIVTSVTNAR